MRTINEKTLKGIYGETIQSGRRYRQLADHYTKHFGTGAREFFTAPGRTEIIGNHTDHNGGRVIAASIDMDTIAAAYPNNSETIVIISEEYRQRISINITQLDQIEKKPGTPSLLAGILSGFREFGYHIGGFNAYLTSNVISSAGVSSSASFEMLLCTIIDYYFNENQLDYTTYARIGQYAEQHYWQKDSGLMDQLACASGGAILLDFSTDVRSTPIDLSIIEEAYQLIIINTGANHADMNQNYSDIPTEMKTVARYLGAENLAGTNLQEVTERAIEIAEALKNDRAVLRAIHFHEENARVQEATRAVKEKDLPKLIRLIEQSGESSWQLLQNCSRPETPTTQRIPLLLKLTDQYLSQTNKPTSTRVHGGGFAGVIQTIIPKAKAPDYINYLQNYIPAKDIHPLTIRPIGATHLS